MLELFITPMSIVFNFFLFYCMVMTIRSEISSHRFKVYLFKNLVDQTELSEKALEERLFPKHSLGHRYRERMISEIVESFDGDKEKETEFYNSLEMIDGPNLYLFSPKNSGLTANFLLFVVFILFIFLASAVLSYSSLVDRCSDFFEWEYKYADYTYENFSQCIYEFKGVRYYPKEDWQ